VVDENGFVVVSTPTDVFFCGLFGKNGAALVAARFNALSIE
jgi:hypothetical protein